MGGAAPVAPPLGIVAARGLEPGFESVLDARVLVPLLGFDDVLARLPALHQIGQRRHLVPATLFGSRHVKQSSDGVEVSVLLALVHLVGRRAQGHEAKALAFVPERIVVARRRVGVLEVRDEAFDRLRELHAVRHPECRGVGLEADSYCTPALQAFDGESDDPLVVKLVGIGGNRRRRVVVGVGHRHRVPIEDLALVQLYRQDEIARHRVRFRQEVGHGDIVVAAGFAIGLAAQELHRLVVAVLRACALLHSRVRLVLIDDVVERGT